MALAFLLPLVLNKIELTYELEIIGLSIISTHYVLTRIYMKTIVKHVGIEVLIRSFGK